MSVNSGDRPAAGNEIGILKTSAVTNGIFEPQENKVVFDEIERGRVKQPVQAGTIIISRMNTPALVGANAYVETSLGNIYLPDRLWAAKSKPGTSMRFVACILGSDKGRAALSKLAKGSSGSMKNISKPDVFAFLIEAPSTAEQQKIADCLSSLDELIATQARKVDALKTHKKGLMQQLFPHEGETQPRLRFPEFRDAGEWEGKSLGDACRMQSGKFIPASEISDEYSSGFLPCYGGNGLRGYVQKNTHDGTFPLIGRQGALCGNVKIAKGQFYATEHALVVSPKSGVHTLWLYYLLDLLSLNQYATGQAQPGLSVEVLNAVPVAVPKQEVEQRRIADCLTSLDTLITAATQELETLKIHKKGLMQQLFPSAEAVQA